MIIEPGHPIPLGANYYLDGINLSLYVKDADGVTILIEQGDEKHEVILDSAVNRTGDVWHVFLKTKHTELKYLYKIDKNNSTYCVLDPYSKELTTPFQWKEARDYPPKTVISMKNFDFENVKPPDFPLNDMIIYETHVRGFTIDASSQVNKPGTFTAIIEKIPFLKELGINAIELMPIFEFNESEHLTSSTFTSHDVTQYWGYSSVCFFSLMNRYAHQSALNEFKSLVKELHLAGIKIILDVVYNHTSEGDKKGPAYSYKILDNSSYYHIGNDGDYHNYSGCGNTFNTNNPIASALILDSLKYFVVETKVDGFRFDLASIFYRDLKGNDASYSSIVEAISQDPILSKTLLIAEPWDAAGLYKVGTFYPEKKRWLDWNGYYRDVVRSFMRGDPFNKGKFANCISGSQNLYYNRSPLSSVNFITSHDGFTLYDLVSYNEKHNEGNGEDNRDGENNNLSWNCGFEGPTDNEEVNSLRRRQLKNFMVSLFISQGIPMLSMGDEYCHTKNGNNNTWCQDNKLNWYDWNQLSANSDFFRFCKKMIQFRKDHPQFRKGKFLDDSDIFWCGKNGFKTDWDHEMHFIGMIFFGESENIYCAFNAEKSDATIKLPSLDNGQKWSLLVYTAHESPDDFLDKSLRLEDDKFVMKSHSSLIAIVNF